MRPDGQQLREKEAVGVAELLAQLQRLGGVARTMVEKPHEARQRCEVHLRGDGRVDADEERQGVMLRGVVEREYVVEVSPTPYQVTGERAGDAEEPVGEDHLGSVLVLLGDPQHPLQKGNPVG